MTRHSDPAEGRELPHIHVRHDRATAKFWLDPVRLARSRRFRDHEIASLQRIMEQNKARLLEAWNGRGVEEAPSGSYNV
ncbi:MAG: DUF4160 domain-containing protein [bacterium]